MSITWRNRAVTTRDIPISLYLFAHSLLRVAAFVCNYLTSFPGRLNNPTLFVFISLQIKYQSFYSNELLFRVKFHSSISILTTFVLSKVQTFMLSQYFQLNCCIWYLRFQFFYFKQLVFVGVFILLNTGGGIKINSKTTSLFKYK